MNEFTAIGAAAALLVTMGLVLLRAVLGPTVHDRILAANAFGTKTVLLLALIAFATERLDFLDLAIAYSLLNFVGTLALLSFFPRGYGRQEATNIDNDETSQ